MTPESKTSLDIDGFNTKVLKAVACCILTPLAHIVNLSFETGIIPTKLKVPRTVPVFKAGSPDNLNNYRPISCLPVMSKILEKIVSIKLYHYLVNNNLLYDLQFGFQPGKATVHPLIHITNFIANAFNNNEIVLQGSILGPLLFLCLINEMHKSNKPINFHFADDTTTG